MLKVILCNSGLSNTAARFRSSKADLAYISYEDIKPYYSVFEMALS